MFSRFFIDRPIFATVLSLTITLAGGIALWELPLAQYPSVTPPTVRVGCSYPGASAQVVAETVAAPIEQQVNGVEDMLYMSSQCTNDGAYGLTVTFKQGVNLNLAQVLVQNRVSLALPMLPDVLKQTGVTARKMSPDMLMSININSPSGKYDQLYLSNYAVMKIRDELYRVSGVGDIFIAGQRDYSIRIWVDPEQLAARSLTAGDVVNAIREQNAQVAAGQIGQSPARPGQKTQITLSTLGRLVEPEEFEDIILRTDAEGRIVRVKDVASVELGARNQDIQSKLDGKPSVTIIISQLPDSNSLDVAARVHAKMQELSKSFPEGIIYEIQYDTTPYTRQCIAEVVKALRDAIILVAFVVLLFLQNWRSALIPLIAVPVAIIGTFAVMAVMGFSLNNLTLFGLVLAIGIVVDDAIVVVESVEHHIEQGLAPREATIKAMSQVSAPVIAVGLVLGSVFIPCAFISGITGQFFRQFALTIAASTIISTFNSLTLSPALAALLLKERDKETHEALPRIAFPLFGGWIGYRWFAPLAAPHLEPWLAMLPAPLADYCVPHAFAITAALSIGSLALIGWALVGPVNTVMRSAFHVFNKVFFAATGIYTRMVGMLLRVAVLVLVAYAGLLFLTQWSFKVTPKGFIPTQDMGYLMLAVQLPDAAAAERTRATVDRVQQICMGTPGVKHTMAIAGNSLLLGASASNFGSLFVILDNFDDRAAPGLSADEIATSLRAQCNAEIPEALVTVMPAPPVRGVGRTGGFKLMVENRGDLGFDVLQQQIDALADLARRQTLPNGKPSLVVAPNVFRANTPQLYVAMNREQCMTMGVSLADAFNTLQIYLGSLYVNDFNRFGRTWAVVVQADAKFRNKVDAARQLRVRGSSGQMVPIGALADIREVNGPLMITRYNMYTAAAIQGTPAPGVSSRQAIDIMQELADRELPPAMHYEWTELSYLELQAGNTAMILFGLAIVMVFLVLAAQYESWSLPLAVILVVPMCLLSAVVGVWVLPGCLDQLAAWLRPFAINIGRSGGQADINIFTQIGFVVLVGLASKNAILIVEFAKRLREQGASRRDAALEACHLRLRPIIMTSFAFILGVVPLLIATGAGAEMRRTLGTAVFSGMLGVTMFGIFLTPVFFCVINWLGDTPWCQNRTMQRIRFWTLGIFALGFVWMLLRLLRDLARTAWRSRTDSHSQDHPDRKD